jgi:iron(III) transport system substrate-binding protein
MNSFLKTTLTPMLAVLSMSVTSAVWADTNWQKSAGVGEFAPKSQDWTAIESAAREEGTVVIYSVSSRIAKLVDGFQEKYGIEIIGHDMPSDLQIEKLRREHTAGINAVDVLFNSDAPLLLNEALPNGLVWNFVPDGLSSDLDAGETQPFLIQRHSSRVVYYNTELNPNGAPIDSLWDLTSKDWTGRTLLPSPLEDGLSANFMQTILNNSDAMAAAYEREYGQAITYSEDVIEAVAESAVIAEPNASIEWLYRFLANEPVFMSSTTKIFKNVGDIEQDNPPLGITTFSKMRKNKKGVYAAAPIYDLDPVFGVSYPTALVMADMAPHPNAAKLLIKYMMEAEGFSPWNEPGDFAARSSIETVQMDEFNLPSFDALKLWPIDPEQIYFSKYGFLALYLGLQ